MIHNGEYAPLINAFNGQTLNISTSTNTYINPFDSSLQYEKDNDEALNNKIEFSLAFIESIVSSNGLTGEQKTLVDRCTKNIYEEYLLHNYDEKYADTQHQFYSKELFKELARQNNCEVVFARDSLNGYWNEPFVYDVYLYK